MVDLPSVLQEYNAKFIPDTRTTREYEQELGDLLLVIGPIAKSILCLEAAHSTVADVFIFFVAFMAEIDDLIKRDKLDLPLPVIEQVRRLCNWRFNKMINEAPSDIFVTGFFLVPGIY